MNDRPDQTVIRINSIEYQLNVFIPMLHSIH